MVQVGLLHSQSGAMAISESALIDAALMAIDEINHQGGLLGEPVVPILRDGASDPETFAAAAQDLLTNAGVNTLFGCWTSACRKAVIPVVTAHQRLLWYPIQYEGLETSPWVFYTGCCLNQQVEPALTWLIEQFGDRIYLIGSDYVFPWTAHKVIRAQIDHHKGTVVGEDLIPLAADVFDFSPTLERIQRTRPNAVFNTLNGQANVAFYRQYQAAGLTPDQVPIMAVSIAEEELQQIGPAAIGHYSAWSYFQSLAQPDNQRFVHAFQQRYGPDRVTSDPIEAAYSQVYLWRQAVELAQSFDPIQVRQAAIGQSFAAPGGSITLQANHHIAKPCRIGRATPDGQFEPLWESEQLITPLPWLGIESAPSVNTAAQAILGDVADWIEKAHQLENALQQLQQEATQRREAELALARAQTEVELTRKLQTMLLPKDADLPNLGGLDIAGSMEPATQVGGDYYDVWTAGNSSINFGIGDVTGHGLASGMIMLMAQTAVRTLLLHGETDLMQLIGTVNQLLYDNTRRMGTYKQMTLALLLYEAGRLQLSGQHESLLIVRADGSLSEVDTLDLGFPLGLEPDIMPFMAQTEVDLEIGDVAVLYTDGITEAMNAENQQYGLDRFNQVLKQSRHLSAAGIHQAVVDDLKQHIGSQMVFDDITLLVLKQQVPPDLANLGL